ncbi:MAG: hypothetical protein DRQ49_12515 [Gammaproteobacteria bacterium]|nr:MAG: hypothetical protein DRQ49_12515 [Gammaproteobacteria bacterium]RKZ73008.1 MAG: hypothetical protein DRQ57_15765 [Gammaproteobacteria bacterium]
MIMRVSANEVKEIFQQLINKKLSREEVAEWAYSRTQDYDNEQLEFFPPEEEGRIWETLQYLEGVDLKENNDTYLHIDSDFFQEFRHKWERQPEIETHISIHPKHEYVVTLPDTLDTILLQIQRKEGKPLGRLINQWVHEKVQQYAKASVAM